MRDFNGRNNSRGRDSGRRFDNRDNRREQQEMHKVICDKCGVSCEVPFKPSSDKPIFCSDCFREKNNSGSSPRPDFRKSSRQGNGDREFFKATCADCGVACEVPFRPTNGKAVYCSVCFEKQEGGNKDTKSSSNNASQFDKQFKILNDKLDEILKHFSPTPVKNNDATKKKEVSIKKEKAVAKPKTVKKVVEKKVAKKKTTKK